MALFGLPAQSQPGRILSTTTLDVFQCNVDGSNCFTVAGHADNSFSSQPSVASDGTIAFEGYFTADPYYNGNQQIFLMDADGTNPRQITNFTVSNCCNNLWPTISPDGTRVAFLGEHINAAPDGSSPQEIYLMNSDGSNLHQLTPFMSINGDYSQSSMVGLAWSPDGTKVAFRGTVYTSQCGTYFGGPIIVNVVGTINADGTNMQLLACDNNDGYVTSLDWSPDGTLLVWGRNISHCAQGNSGCVGEPTIAFYDFSGQGRYSAGITSAQLGTDSCQGGPHCIHFSPDGSRLAYANQYGQVSCGGAPCVSLINLDGSGQTNTNMQNANRGLWWVPGAAIPVPAQLTLAGSAPNVPPNPVEIWPGSPQQLVPTLSDSSGNVIFHSAATFPQTSAYGHYACLNVGPYGLAFYTFDSNTGTVFATNAGLTSNAVPYICWASSPCTFSLGSMSTDLPSSGGTGTITVSANAGSSGSTCPWNAMSGASWVTITSGANGSGNGNVNFSAATNSGTARQASITVAGLVYTVYQDAGTGIVTLQSITVAPNPASVAAGLTQQFVATGNYSDGSSKNLTTSVTWSSSNTSIATVNSGGLAMGIAQGGPVTISAALSGVYGTAQLTVTAPVLQSITVSPAAASVAAGLTQQYGATGHYSDGSTQVLTSSATWSSSNTGIATISSSGLATAVSTGGPVTITAALNGISGTAQLTVTPPVLQSITVSPAAASVAAGFTQQFGAMGSYSDGSNQTVSSLVTWSSSNTSIATISSSGLARGVAAGGPVTITASLNSVSGTAQLAVTAPVLLSIVVSPVNPTVIARATQQFTANGRYSDGSRQNLTNTVSWTSSNSGVATISASGLASAWSAGSTTIGATLGNFSSSTTMTVITLQSVTIAPLSQTIFAGSTLQFTATGHYSDGSTRDLTSSAQWNSSKTSTATITSPGGLATGVNNGATTITGSFGGFSASTTLTINAVLLQSIAVTPASVTVPAFGTQQFTATGYYNNGTTQDLTGVAAWSLAPKWVAVINSTGLATGSGPAAGYSFPGGTATINAKYLGVVGSATLTVLP